MAERTTDAHVADLLRRGKLSRAEVAACLVSLAAAILSEPDPPAEPEIKPHTPEPHAVDGDRLLTAEQVALALGLDVGAVARRRFPFRVKLGRRTVRYSSAGLGRWMRNGGRA